MIEFELKVSLCSLRGWRRLQLRHVRGLLGVRGGGGAGEEVRQGAAARARGPGGGVAALAYQQAVKGIATNMPLCWHDSEPCLAGWGGVTGPGGAAVPGRGEVGRRVQPRQPGPASQQPLSSSRRTWH